ncbi:hypothetical protein TH8_19500 [Thalassospira profundimaris]|nr:hypothetical protein TH8_19500 [Thalassospira profundimaris]
MFRKFEKHVLSSTVSTREDAFSSLEFISEIEENGIEFLRAHGHTKNLKTTWKYLQAFIRQAKTFYESAESLNYRASSLSYYYAFHNLAKAYIAVQNPDGIRGRMNHGLILPLNPTQNNKQSIEVRGGAFQLFYELLTKNRIPNKTRLNLRNLLAFCTDVQLEYGLCGYGITRVLPFSIGLASETNNGPFHVISAVVNFDVIRKCSKSLHKFNGFFEEVEMDKRTAREVFDLKAEDTKNVTFFESNETFDQNEDGSIALRPIYQSAYKAFENMFEMNPYDFKFPYYLVAPLRENFQIPMRETIAIYAIMFYLGSLVRYNPRYLEDILSSKDGWIIERFVSSSPTTFLRSIRNLIDGRNFIYAPR